MDFQYILKNGYEKLLPYLPETDKEYINGFRQAIETRSTFKDNIDDYVENDVEAIAAIEKEVAEITTDNAIEFLNETLDEIKVSFIDNNHYSVDENGNVVDDGE